MSQSASDIVAKDIMTRKLVTLQPTTDVFKGIEALIKHKISGAPVVDGDHKLVGMFTEKSCLEVLIDAAYEGLPTNDVGAFMSDPADTITEDTGLLTMAQIFINKKTRRLPVIANGRLVGQVSRRDVMKAASKIVRTSPDRAGTLLYLSALRKMQEAPQV